MTDNFFCNSSSPLSMDMDSDFFYFGEDAALDFLDAVNETEVPICWKTYSESK